MNEIKWLPSYARPGAQVVFNKETLRTGELQAEALVFFKWVSRQVEPHHLNDAFRAILADYPGAMEAQGEFTLKDNFLNTTVALALLKDIGPLTPYIINDNVALGKVTALIKDLSAGLEIDVVDQLTRKGDLDLKMFCKLYSVSGDHLAIKTVADDNAVAFYALRKENPGCAYKALARFPYNPLSAIRADLGKPAGEIPYDEMDCRIRNQFTAFYDHTPLINTSKPVCLQPLQGVSYESLDAIDHQLRALPDYVRLLGTYHDVFLPYFGANTRQIKSLEADQIKLMAQLIEDMEKAGISRIDILMHGVLSYSPHSEDLEWKQPPADREVKYKAMTAEQKQAIYLPLLLENAAHCGDDPQGWQNQPKLLQINHFLRKEPIEALEALCTTTSHWNALYRATGDRQYVAKLGDRVDKVFGEDLGL